MFHIFLAYLYIFLYMQLMVVQWVLYFGQKDLIVQLVAIWDIQSLEKVVRLFLFWLQVDTECNMIM